MKNNKLIIALSVLMLLAFTTSGFAKQIEKDEAPKKKIVKAQSKKQAIKKAETTSTEIQSKKDNVSATELNNQTNTSSTDLLNRLQTELPAQSTSSQAGEQINWQVISAGGNTGSSTNYILSSTIGQTAVGLATSTNFQLNSGFWQTFGGSSGCCIGIRGNVDNDPMDETDISDLVFIVDFIFTGGDTPECFEEANVDGDPMEEVDISDLVYIVDFIFTGGDAPPSCP